MADSADKYVAGRGNPSLDPTRTDLSASAFTRDKNGTLVEKSKLASQNALIDAREKSAFGRNSQGILTRHEDIKSSNAWYEANKSKFGTPESVKSSLDLDSNLSAEMKARMSKFGTKEENANWKKNYSIGASWDLGPKTELANTQRDISGGGAKSGMRPSKKLSSFGRSVPYDDYSPTAVKSQFFKQAVKSFKHFVPQFGLYGSGFHGGPIRIKPMKWEGAFPVMDVQQWDASTSTTFTQDEDND
jgi:hypothetical protein